MSIFNYTDGTSFTTVTDAINASSAGDWLLIPTGLYVEEFPILTHSLTLQGVGGMAHLMTPNPAPANDRAVLFVAHNAGADLTVRNIEISGVARPVWKNGAGILFESGNGHLQVEDSWFHHNENGILAGSGTGMTVSIVRSEFNNNGLDPNIPPPAGIPHNLYVNEVDSLTVTDSYFHGVQTGHELKSRARENTITDSRFVDGPTSQGSYVIDLPNAGAALISGNQIAKGPLAPNRHIIHYGGEAIPGHPNSQLTVTGNTISSERGGGSTGIFNESRDGPGGTAHPTVVTDNVFYGVDEFMRTAWGPASDTVANNQFLPAPAPAISTAHPWRIVEAPTFAVPEPLGALLLGPALLAIAVLRRHRSRIAA